jgi:hypothetical protein
MRTVLQVRYIIVSLTYLDLAQLIQSDLLDLKPDLRILPRTSEMSSELRMTAVKGARNIIVLLTNGSLQMPGIQNQLKASILERKNIIVVHDERNCKLPENIPSDIASLIRDQQAIPFFWPKSFRKSSLQMIMDRMK